ncbi:FecR family protein [Mucilaginibacter pineti]|uniref:FecR family protein n=1 Tax=Mucilaginibacter pineti TaxID=1391627 RepID=A0A1G6U643_9SPHI|nr:FecR domain-containing protein [Mucilaginibacter pineti]SDD36850.1 FecR family protein [Mucilaginibacter pineti]
MKYNISYIQELIIDHVGGTISDDDNDFLQRAIAEDADVKQLWNEMQYTLTSGRGKDFLGNLDENKAWKKIELKIDAQPPISKFKGFSKWLPIAAILCMAITTVYYLQPKPIANPIVIAVKKTLKPVIELKLANGQHINLSDTSKQIINTSFAHLKKGTKGLSYELNDNKTEEWSTLVIPPQLTYQIALSDGTQVWLNSASSMRFPFSFSGKTRDVYLTGEAFFKVAKNAAKPFIVHTNQTDVQVLGTEFNVNTYKSNTTITSLVEGSVSTNGHNNQKLLLHPGYQAIYAPENGFLTQSFDPGIELAWMHNIYYFHNTKLNDISEVLLRWFDIKVVFDDPAKADEAFSGAIQKNKPIDVFIQNIKTSAGVKATFKDGVLHIK